MYTVVPRQGNQQRSLGEESYQGAKGGFVFVCPSAGTIKVKLYATSEQFPAILYQVLQEVEAEGYACREIYVDTFKVNFSAAAEEKKNKGIQKECRVS